MRFLIADEDPSCRTRWIQALGPQTACDEATGGREAIALFRRAWDNDQGYDAVLMDVTMPDMDGHETLQRFRNVEQEFGVYGADGAKVVMFGPPSVVKQLARDPHVEYVGYLARSSDAEDLLAELEALGACDNSLQSALTAL